MRLRWWLAAVALLAAVSVIGWGVTRVPSAPPVDTAPAHTTTVPVTRGDVAARVQVTGVLGFDKAYTIVNQLPNGVITAVAEPGTSVVRGADLYEVAGVAAVLLYGATPAYRDFEAGMTDGADVTQLEENLVALGFDPLQAITVDQHFSDATATAIRRWQTARGLPPARRTGLLTLGQIIFLPGAIRVGELLAEVGASAGPGEPMLSATATTRVVRVAITAGRQFAVHPGDPVLVTVPGLTEPVTGTVREIGAVATAPSEGNGPATVPMIVTLTLPADAPPLDQAPVQVAITGERHTNVLLIPVTALLAGEAGGYQVAVIDDTGRRLVPVQLGLFDEASGTVEVMGDTLTEGNRVEVPTS